jgi:hypothetical protein
MMQFPPRLFSTLVNTAAITWRIGGQRNARVRGGQSGA